MKMASNFKGGNLLATGCQRVKGEGKEGDTRFFHELSGSIYILLSSLCFTRTVICFFHFLC